MLTKTALGEARGRFFRAGPYDRQLQPPASRDRIKRLYRSWLQFDSTDGSFCLHGRHQYQWSEVPEAPLVAKGGRGTHVARGARGTHVARCARGTHLVRGARGTRVAKGARGTHVARGARGTYVVRVARAVQTVVGSIVWAFRAKDSGDVRAARGAGAS